MKINYKSTNEWLKEKVIKNAGADLCDCPQIVIPVKTGIQPKSY
jgi:hypothetical protein